MVHSLTVSQPLVMTLAVLIPWSKILPYCRSASQLIPRSCRQISQRSTYMGCRRLLVRDPKKAHLVHRDPLCPRHRAYQSFHPSLLPSPGIARHIQSLQNHHLGCNRGSNRVHDCFLHQSASWMQTYLWLLGAVERPEHSARKKIQLQ